MTKIIIAGSKGRMGRTLLQCAVDLPELTVVGEVDLEDDLATIIDLAEVLVDFSAPAATAAFCELCAQHRRAVVIGTTGLDPGQEEIIHRSATHIPIVWAANYSMGVNALFWLTRHAVDILGPGFDLEVIEMHHRHKKDAPSGTAVTLARILAEARQTDMAQVVRHGRVGQVGERSASEIGVHSLRGGDVVGDHTVVFAAPGERVELSHRASSRETFARGALRAAQWVRKQSPGLYSMQDVLGLK